MPCDDMWKMMKLTYLVVYSSEQIVTMVKQSASAILVNIHVPVKYVALTNYYDG